MQLTHPDLTRPIERARQVGVAHAGVDIAIAVGRQAMADDTRPFVAVIGGVLALTVHGIKSATRPVVTATTVGVGNPLMSIGEDIGALITTILAIFLPIIGVIVLAVALLLFARPISRGVRALFGWDRQPATAVGSGAEPDQTLPGL